jgi:hypothetical protein
MLSTEKKWNKRYYPLHEKGVTGHHTQGPADAQTKRIEHANVPFVILTTPRTVRIHGNILSRIRRGKLRNKIDSLYKRGAGCSVVDRFPGEMHELNQDAKKEQKVVLVHSTCPWSCGALWRRKRWRPCTTATRASFSVSTLAARSLVSGPGGRLR